MLAAVFALFSGCLSKKSGSDSRGYYCLAYVWKYGTPNVPVAGVQVQFDLDKVKQSREVIPNTGRRYYATSAKTGIVPGPAGDYDLGWTTVFYNEGIRGIAQATHRGETVADTEYVLPWLRDDDESTWTPLVFEFHLYVEDSALAFAHPEREPLSRD
jgi:hypothetical protein